MTKKQGKDGRKRESVKRREQKNFAISRVSVYYVCVCERMHYTSIYIKNRSSATIRDLFLNKEPPADPREIMWVTKTQVGSF